MKRGMVLFLTLVLMAAMAVTTATALEVESSILVRGQSWISEIAFVNDRQLVYLSGEYERSLVSWELTTGSARKLSRDLSLDVNTLSTGIASPRGPNWTSGQVAYTENREIRMRYTYVRDWVEGSDFGDRRRGDWFGQPPWHTEDVTSLAFKPGDFILASGSDDDTVRIWEFGDDNIHRHVFTLQGHTNNVSSVAWHPDRHILASASWDGTVRLWETRNGTYIIHLDHPDHQGVSSIAWSPDGTILVSMTGNGGIHFWNVEDLNNITYVHSLWDLRVAPDSPRVGGAVAFSPDGETLAGATNEGGIYVWNPNTFALKAMTAYGAARFAFSPDGKILAGVRVRRGEDPDGTGESPEFDIILHRFVGDAPADEGDTTTEESDAPADEDDTATEESDAPADEDDTAISRLIAVLGTQIADVNRDGEIDWEDLVEVAENYGLPVWTYGDGDGDFADPDADINKDGKVDVIDVLVMIVVLDAPTAPAAPALTQADIETGSLQASDVQQWLRDAKAANADPAGIAALERLLTSLNRRNLPVPKETVLLANYPNPFNPETWIPYQLSEAAEVTVTIHSSDGKLVRTLELGQMPAGAYSDKDRAAYWDGRNAQGEPVASGVYFYTLRAGDFSATRKMVIRK